MVYWFFFSHSCGHPLNFGHALKLVLGGKFLCLLLCLLWLLRSAGGVIPGVLLRVTLECTRGAVLMLAFVVGVDEVFTLCSCLVSNFSVAVSNIFCKLL